MLVLIGQSRVHGSWLGVRTCLPCICRNYSGASQEGHWRYGGHPGDRNGARQAQQRCRNRAIEAEPLQQPGSECCKLSLWV